MGGGPSGSLAAIAAARCGVRTLLLEQYAFLGGSLTAMGVGPMMSFHNPRGEQVVMGIAQELIERLMDLGASPGHIPDTTTYCSTVTPFDSEALKIELETMLTEAGGEVLYHTQLAEAVLDQVGQLTGIRVCNKAGLSVITAQVFVDATGDADLASACGVPFIKGRASDGAAQPMTMNLKVANVDTDKIRAYVQEHPEEFGFTQDVAVALERMSRSPRLSLGGYKSAWNAAKARGELDVPREGILMFETATPGVIIVNSSRIQGLDATNPRQLSQAEAIGRKQCRQIFTFLKNHCIGFENAVRMDSSSQVGVRESRHVQGLYLLTAEDLVHEKQFEDPIALGGYPIDIHSPNAAETNHVHMRDNAAYQIPLRSLLLAKPGNLVVSGRCISATHEASAAFRVTPIAMAIGQAAGTVAALAALSGTTPAQVPYAQLRAQLLQHGARLPIMSAE